MLKREVNPLKVQSGRKIADVFWNLYQTGGMENISITKICKIAHYNRSTFYANYEDIYDVLNQIELSLISPSEFQSIILEKLITLSPEEAVVSSILSLYEKNEKYLPVLLGPKGDASFRRKLLESLIPIISKTFQKHEMNQPLFLYTLEYQNAAVFAVISLWYENGKDISKEELLHLLICLTVSGVRNQLVTKMR